MQMFTVTDVQYKFQYDLNLECKRVSVPRVTDVVTLTSYCSSNIE